MIYTITLNTAIDNIIKLTDFSLGKISTAEKIWTFPAGKGINVSKTIESLGESSTASGFVGKNDFDCFQNISTNDLKINLLKTSGKTRQNFTIVDSKKGLVSHIRGLGFEVSPGEFESLILILTENLKENDLVIISGSIPLGLPKGSYKKLVAECNYKKAKVILDSSEPFLKYGIQSKPYAIKPNVDELFELSKVKSKKTLKNIVEIAKGINHKGVEYVFVSLGKDGLLICKRGLIGYYLAHLNLNQQQFVGEEIGCGDAMVGAIAIGIQKENSIDEIAKLAVATGTANLFKIGPGLVDKKNVTKLKKSVIIQYFS